MDVCVDVWVCGCADGRQKYRSTCGGGGEREGGATGAGSRGGKGRREGADGAVGAGIGAWRGLVLARHTCCACAAVGAGVARVTAAGVAACFGVVCGASARGRCRERYAAGDGAEQQRMHILSHASQANFHEYPTVDGRTERRRGSKRVQETSIAGKQRLMVWVSMRRLLITPLQT